MIVKPNYYIWMGLVQGGGSETLNPGALSGKMDENPGLTFIGASGALETRSAKVNQGVAILT